MLGPAGHQLVQNGHESRGQAGAELGDRDRFTLGPAREAFHHGLTRERNLASQQVIHRAAQAEQVTSAVDLARGRLLGRHVIERTDTAAGGSGERGPAVRFQQDTQAEVEDLDQAPRR